jgi:hypothetical protein
MTSLTRRSLTFVLGGMALALAGRHAEAAPRIVVNKDPNCGCCTAWVEHLRGAGFEPHVNELSDLAPLKKRLAVPPALSSCHTAEVEGYVIEGHVPASAIRRLLAERPSAIGLAVPGMPIGSPGMEVPGSPDETYDVVLFGPTSRRTYARYKGSKERGLQP